MKNEKGVVQILLVIGIVAALAVIGYALYSQKVNSLPKTSVYNPQAVPTELQPSYQQAGQSVTPINSAGDLNSVSASLDTEDMSQIDLQLKSLDSATSGF